MFDRTDFLTDPAEIRRIIQRETLGAVPIRDALPGVSIATDGRQYITPTVFIDARNRPDLRDLIRVHRLDGDGDVSASWRYALDADKPLAILNAEFTAPATARIRLVFGIRKRRPFLAQVTQVGRFYLSTGRPRADLHHTGVIGVPVPTNDLRAMLELIGLVDHLRVAAKQPEVRR
jgi:hypothetical protein